MPSIQIKSVPPGEAPLEILEAGVGLELPLFRNKPRRYLGSGVLSGPRNTIQTLIHLMTFRLRVHTSYVVPSLAAIEILGKGPSERGALVARERLLCQSSLRGTRQHPGPAAATF